MKRYVSICPNCGRVYRHIIDKTQNCFGRSCATFQTMYSGYTEAEWDKLTDDERKDIIWKISKADPETIRRISEVDSSTANDSSTINDSTYKALDFVAESNFWISSLDTFANVLIFLGILGSLIGGATLFEFSALTGFLVIVLGTLLTIVVGGSVKIFIGIAKDVNYLRKSKEKESKG